MSRPLRPKRGPQNGRSTRTGAGPDSAPPGPISTHRHGRVQEISAKSGVALTSRLAIDSEAWSTRKQKTEEGVMLEEVGPRIDEAGIIVKKIVSKP